MTDIADKIARKIIDLQAQQAEIAEAIENYKQKLADVVGEGEKIVGDNENGHIKVVAYRHKSYNEAYGKRNRPDLWEKFAVTTRVLDSSTAKKNMTEEEYAEFQKPSDKGLSVKLEVLGDD